MPPHNLVPGSPEHWLAMARADLDLAAMPLRPGGFYENSCYHAQQAPEKALKAAYVSRRVPFQYTHDLKRLVDGLSSLGLQVPIDEKAAALLTKHAYESRYPGVDEFLAESDRDRAVAAAGAILQWAESILGMAD